MAVKRLCKQPPETQLKPLKRLRLGDEEQQPNTTTMADRLSTLPEDLQIRILSSLDTKLAFETSLLSKAWSSKWTHVPVLDLNSYSFNNKLGVFDKFVYGVLSVPRSAPLVRINFIRLGKCTDKILKKVFDYAFEQGVEELDVSIRRNRKGTSWPMIMSHASCESLKCLKLESRNDIGCSYLGPKSGSFKNLASLHLRNAIIMDPDPFSGFPVLKKLKLVFCCVRTDDNTLSVHAPHLLELTISYCEYGGYCEIPQRKKLFDDLMIFLNVLRNVNSLAVYSSVVHILSLFPDELENRCSPFRDLKSLEVDLSLLYRQKLFEGKCRLLSEVLKQVSHVKSYLLQKSPDAKYTIIDPDAPLNVQYICLNAHECICGSRLSNTTFHIR
ncbi:F-box/LRR-repeat protein At3g26922-like [Bidens hawaiensis]|uniref:F-box/LRR-repeat protein At3g26922-like n=1 Tax=Bidens hawaiensis TaxID=980011 RepID=UPI0040492069